MSRYWSLDHAAASAKPSRREAAHLTRKNIERSLERCLVSDVPIAVLLSGGIDSSANVALLSNLGHRDVRTFSVVFAGGSRIALDEAPYSRLVARTFQTQHTEVTVNVERAKELVPIAVRAMDLPSHDGVNTFLVCDAIRRAGIKVAISGQGSDEIFLGYPQRRFFSLAATASSVVPRAGKRFLSVLQGSRVWGNRWRAAKIAQAMSTDDPAVGAYVALHSVFADFEIAKLRGHRRPPASRFVAPVTRRQPFLNRLSQLQLTTYLRNVLLRDADQMSMANGIELRAPFVDSDLVEFILGLPASYKLDRNRNKPLLLDAVGSILPREVWDRPKSGFGLPYDKWIREGLRVATIEAEELGLTPDGVREVEKNFLRGAYPTRFWTLQVLAAWAKRERMGARWL